MRNFTTHSAQEVSALYGQLSEGKQNELFAYLYAMVENEKRLQTKHDRDDALEDFIGCAMGETNKTLTIEEMNEIIADGWAHQ